MSDVPAQRARLVEIEQELARLQRQHDLAMSAFQFDEANGLQRRIEMLEDERRAVAAGLPPVASHPEVSSGAIPVVLTRQRVLRARRRRQPI